MTTERPLGKIRMDRLRANGGGAAAEPAQAGRHRRPINPDTETATVPADADHDGGR